MNFMKGLLKRQARETKHRRAFALYLKNRIRTYQARLDEKDFEDEDEAVNITRHIQRLIRIIDELEEANTQGQGLQRSAM